MAYLSILVSVFASPRQLGERRKLFARSVEVDASVSFPFNQVYDSLTLLFGKNCIIEFVVNSNDST